MQRKDLYYQLLKKSTLYSRTQKFWSRLDISLAGIEMTDHLTPLAVP